MTVVEKGVHDWKPQQYLVNVMEKLFLDRIVMVKQNEPWIVFNPG